MILALRPRIVAVLLGLFALWPALVKAGMTPEEVGIFAKIKEDAERGIASDQRNLGFCYSDGRGVARDNMEAVRWYRKAAEQGDAMAQWNLGFFYLIGKGVVKDHVEAVRWFRKAAEQGDAWGQFRLGSCYFNGEGVTKDQVEAVRWYRKAAEQGEAVAQFELGLCYATGEGVAKDEIEAYAYFNISGITYEGARRKLTILENQMSPDARLLGQQRTKQLQKEIEGRLESTEEVRKAIEKERSKGA